MVSACYMLVNALAANIRDRRARRLIFNAIINVVVRGNFKASRLSDVSDVRKR